ncbi:YbgC/FadM family acyl-CoA thioesterase [Acidovorax sp. SUPP3334]|nr:YbgC/FadM family acyl-CoA thioesterase [Acidovorax sp. SUPP3334]
MAASTVPGANMQATPQTAPPVAAQAAPPAAAASRFEWPLRIYWEDTDAGGIVFYANYLKFFERARTEWLRSLGLGQHHLRELTGGMFVVTDARLRYLSPARLDDELIVTASLQEHGRASLTIRQQALLKPEQMSQPQSLPIQPVLLCEGTIRIGWVDAATLRPARIPGTLLEQLSS